MFFFEKWLAERRRRKEIEVTLLEAEGNLHAAREIQESMLPAGPPAVSGFDIAGASFAANTVGGDFLDYIPMPNGHTAIAVGDVSGHGLASALLMAETRAYVRALALTRGDVGEILTLTNRVLMDDSHQQFITLFLANIDPHSCSFRYAGAGHEAYLFGDGGQIRRLHSTSLPLGLAHDLIVPSSSPISLDSGQLLVLWTDGVFETLSCEERQFGIARGLDVVQSSRHRSASQIIEAFLEELQYFAGGKPPIDDVTLVVVKALAGE